jgi:hypothetical protein
MDMQRTVYYLPGHSGRLHTGLGEALMSRGLNLAGRETVGDFRSIRFMDQVQTVAEDLRTHFWRDDAQVVANSFGAYLFLNAQSVLPPYPGKVLLLSPIVGAFDHPDKPVGFSPPNAHPTDGHGHEWRTLVSLPGRDSCRLAGLASQPRASRTTWRIDAHPRSHRREEWPHAGSRLRELRGISRKKAHTGSSNLASSLSTCAACASSRFFLATMFSNRHRSKWP